MSAHGTLSCYTHHGCRCDLCKEAIRAWRKDYCARNRELVRTSSREYYWRNRDAVLAKKRESYDRHRLQHKLKNESWRRANKDYQVRLKRERRHRIARSLDCSRNHQPWTAAEDGFVMSHDDVLVIAVTLKRNPEAIKTRRYFLRKRGKILSTTPGKD